MVGLLMWKMTMMQLPSLCCRKGFDGCCDDGDDGGGFSFSSTRMQMTMTWC
jgi:hypothetical protein